MKFNYVIGNPPYQGPNAQAGRGSKKIYFQITNKMLNQYTDQMAFITPKPIIMDGVMNTSFTEITNRITQVQDAQKYFKEATNAIWFLLGDPGPPGPIESTIGVQGANKIVKTENGNRRLFALYSDNAEIFYPEYLKLSHKHNNHQKLKIRPSHFPIGHRANNISKTDKGYGAILHQSNGSGPGGRKVKYLNTPLLDNPQRALKPQRLIIAYSSKWFTPFITDLELSEFFGVLDYPGQEENVISYLSTDTIKDFIINFSEMNNSNYFNGLWQLSEVDFSHPWTDAEVQEEFDM